MRFNIALAALAASVAAATPAVAAPGSATAPAEARGVVLQSLTLSNIDDLDFGVVAGSALAPGTVSVNANTNVRSVSGGVVALPGAFTRARFDGYGEANQLVQLTLTQPASGVLISGANSLPATLNLNSGGTLRTIGSTGSFTVYVGGDFGIALNQPNGLYAAQFDLTADYQ